MYIHLDWHDWAVQKIARHHVTADEVEEVLYSPRHVAMRVGRRRYLVRGQAGSGRYLVVVLDKEGDMFTLITAYDMDEADRRLYHRKVRG